jgi:hypothetical protein
VLCKIGQEAGITSSAGEARSRPTGRTGRALAAELVDKGDDRHVAQPADLNGWTDDEKASRSAGLALARRAYRVAGDYPDVLCNVAYVLAYFGEYIATATTLIDRLWNSNRALPVVGGRVDGSG